MKDLAKLCLLFTSFLLCCGATDLTDEDLESDTDPVLDGAWRWNFVMPDGSNIRPKLVISTENGKVTGSTSFRPGTETAITNAAFNGRELRFQVVRHRPDRTVITTYSGLLSETTLNGKITSNWDGTWQTYPWVAQRAHVGVEGVWSWTNRVQGSTRGAAGQRARAAFSSQTRVILEQDGEKITGKTLSRGSRPIRITNGSITNSEVSFEIARELRQTKIVTRYHGKQTGDTIVGTMEYEANGRTRKTGWEARRLD